MSEAAYRNLDTDAPDNGRSTVAEAIASQLRADPQHQDRMRRLRAALDNLARDGRKHDLEEIGQALERHGL